MLALVLACVAVAASLPAQQPAPAAPATSVARDARDAESVAAMAFTALMERRWRDFPPLVHPAMLAEFRARQLSMIRQRELAEREPARMRDSTMPPEVAAWFEAQQRKYAEQMGSPLEQEFGVHGYTDLVLLTPEEMLGRWLEAQDPARSVARSLAGRADSAALRSSALAITPRPWRRVLGSVVEDDSTAQVLYRSATVAGGSFLGADAVSVLTMRRTPAGWRVWRGWEDGRGMNFMIGLSGNGGLQQLLDSAATMVVAWPESHSTGGASSIAPGRAFVDGYTGGLRAPRAFVVESTTPGGSPVRVEIPPSAFQKLSELLAPWPVARDSAAVNGPNEPAPPPARRP